MRKILSLLALLFIFSTVFAQSEILLIGATKTIQTTVCRIDVNGNECSTIHNVYRSPTGWQILTFKPIVVARSRASYTFSQTPSRFLYSSASAIYSKFIELLELAAERNVFEKYEATISQMKNDFEKYFNQKVHTYSAITTTGSVNRMNGFDKGRGGRLYLNVEIKLVYMPDSEEQCLQSLEELKQLISTE